MTEQVIRRRTQADINVLGYALLRAVEREIERNPVFRAEVDALERSALERNGYGEKKQEY